MNRTSIEWCNRPETDGPRGAFTWNPIRARKLELVDEGHRAMVDSGRTGTFCTRISPGCTHCYASAINMRFGTGEEYTVPNLSHHKFFIDERILAEPLKRRKPATIFVGDMFDLFHEAITDGQILRVILAAARAPQHTFQFLTKRPQRMHEWFMRWADTLEDDYEPKLARGPEAVRAAHKSGRAHLFASMLDSMGQPPAGAAYPLYDWMEGISRWPASFYFRHFWLGVSVEDQQRADERIPLLLQTPAAVRFLSVEPQLEPVDLGWYLANLPEDEEWPPHHYPGKIDWIICGGESGPGARPFNLSWAKSLLEQCRAASVPFFMKQVGALPDPRNSNIASGRARRSIKGSDPTEWPEHLRVREFPALNGAGR
jgi:protein gp37